MFSHRKASFTVSARVSAGRLCRALGRKVAGRASLAAGVSTDTGASCTPPRDRNELRHEDHRGCAHAGGLAHARPQGVGGTVADQSRYKPVPPNSVSQRAGLAEGLSQPVPQGKGHRGQVRGNRPEVGRSTGKGHEDLGQITLADFAKVLLHAFHWMPMPEQHAVEVVPRAVPYNVLGACRSGHLHQSRDANCARGTSGPNPTT